MPRDWVERWVAARGLSPLSPFRPGGEGGGTRSGKRPRRGADGKARDGVARRVVATRGDAATRPVRGPSGTAKQGSTGSAPWSLRPHDGARMGGIRGRSAGQGLPVVFPLAVARQRRGHWRCPRESIPRPERVRSGHPSDRFRGEGRIAPRPGCQETVARALTSVGLLLKATSELAARRTESPDKAAVGCRGPVARALVRATASEPRASLTAGPTPRLHRGRRRA